jgi:hypothetical protein
VCGDHHDDGLGALLLRGVQHVHAGEPAAQGEIGEHQVEGAVLELPDGLLPGARDLHLVALAPHQARERDLDRAFVLDDQNASLHDGRSSRRGCF